MLLFELIRWAIGVLTYEMRCGHSPFESKSQMEMFKKITKRDFKFPRCVTNSLYFGARCPHTNIDLPGHSDFNAEEQDFIGGLLQVDLTRRLGNLHGGTDDIRGHPYFASIDWEKLLAGVSTAFASHDQFLCSADKLFAHYFVCACVVDNSITIPRACERTRRLDEFRRIPRGASQMVRQRG